MNTQSAFLKVITIALAIIGLLAVIAFGGMAAMHLGMGSMMQGEGMWQGMAAMCGSIRGS